jgi:hypothetical protein
VRRLKIFEISKFLNHEYLEIPLIPGIPGNLETWNTWKPGIPGIPGIPRYKFSLAGKK